jgi:GYF domain 2
MSEVSGVHQWYIARDGKQTGPISDMEIKAIAAHGYFKATDLVWRAGFAEWQPALSIFVPAVVPPPLAQRPAAPVVAAPIVPAPLPSSSLRQLELRPTEPRTGAPVMREQTAGRPALRADERPTQPASSQQAPTQQAPTQQAWTPPSPEEYLDPRQQNGAYGAMGGHDPRFGAQLPQAYPVGTNTLEVQASSPGQPTQARAMRPAALGDEPEAELPTPKTNRMAMAALLIFVAALAGGIWVAASPGLLGGTTSGVFTAATGVLGGGRTTSSGSLDAKLQKTAHWPVIKREFPDWYGERLREAASLAADNKSDDEIAKALVDQMILLRRQNSGLALSASTGHLKTLAGAFLTNLKSLKQKSTTDCFNFISQGESTPALQDMLSPSSAKSSAIQLQVAAIFEAIGDGRKNPVTHERPQKADYDVLMAQLNQLGWSQGDVATFADPRALAKAPPERVCQMVEDWFTAHIAIPDAAVQERLLTDTLRPVVSG